MTLNRTYLPKDLVLVEGFTSELVDVDRDGTPGSARSPVTNSRAKSSSSVILWGNSGTWLRRQHGEQTTGCNRL